MALDLSEIGRITFEKQIYKDSSAFRVLTWLTENVGKKTGFGVYSFRFIAKALNMNKDTVHRATVRLQVKYQILTMGKSRVRDDSETLFSLKTDRKRDTSETKSNNIYITQENKAGSPSSRQSFSFPPFSFSNNSRTSKQTTSNNNNEATLEKFLGLDLQSRKEARLKEMAKAAGFPLDEFKRRISWKDD